MSWFAGWRITGTANDVTIILRFGWIGTVQYRTHSRIISPVLDGVKGWMFPAPVPRILWRGLSLRRKAIDLLLSDDNSTLTYFGVIAKVRECLQLPAADTRATFTRVADQGFLLPLALLDSR
jgi:hypothetical protein